MTPREPSLETPEDREEREREHEKREEQRIAALIDEWDDENSHWPGKFSE